MKSREKIINAAIQILGKIPEGSMESIGERAGLSRMTIARHFGNKEQLIASTRQYCLDQYDIVIEEQIKSSKSSILKLEQILEGMIPLYESALFLLRYLEWYKHSPELSQYQSQLAKINSIIEDCKKEGDIRKDLPSDWITTFLNYVALGMGEMNDMGAVAPKKSAKLAVESFLYGCSGKSKDL